MFPRDAQLDDARGDAAVSDALVDDAAMDDRDSGVRSDAAMGVPADAMVDGQAPSVDAAADSSGPDAGPSCVEDSDCGDTATFRCFNGQCVLVRAPSAVIHTGGGGLTRSGSFQLRLSIGAPAPVGGPMQSENYQITVGAGAGRP